EQELQALFREDGSGPPRTYGLAPARAGTGTFTLELPTTSGGVHVRPMRNQTMHRLRILTWLLVGLMISLGPAAAVQAQEATEPIVQSIAVRGNQRVPAEVILDQIKASRIGRPVDPEALQKDAQAILELGTIESVSFHMPV